MAERKITVGIIGLGLIGGSLALRLKEAGFATQSLGFDANEAHASKAVALGLVDTIGTLPEVCHKSDVILVAIPVDHALVLLPQIMSYITEKSVVIDFGSTKSKISRLANSLDNGNQFVACHPIAGTENTGPTAAFPSLFEGKVNIICDAKTSSDEAIEMALDISAALGMHVKYMDSTAHDRHIAYVSHMSHISSFILGQTVLEVEKDEDRIFDMAGSGFASTVRLAKSSPEMWAPIFTENAENILGVLDHYIQNLNDFRKLIREKNDEQLVKIMKETNKIRKVLEGDRE